MFTSLIENQKQIKQIFEQHQVVWAYVFGSAISDSFSETSDVDFLVKFVDKLDPLEKGELWWSLHDTLRELLQREIDIVTESSLKNPFFIEEICNTKKLIYKLDGSLDI